MTINKRLLAAATIAAILGNVSAAHAASGNSSTAAGTASATVVAPIVLTHTAGAALNFGKITVGAGGTVVVASGGAGSVTGDVGFVPGSTNAADQFSLTGDNSRNFGITTTGGTITNGSKTMTFITAASSGSGTTSTTGTYSFTVGGTLTVTGTETPGSYTGTYNATVTYQ
jgi:hydroxyethylthiazole kinase-like sugar kinase family protein